MITITELTDKKDLKRFIKFPFSLYKNNPYWTPSIINNELDNLNPEINPVFKNAEARYFVAVKNGKWVGRIAVIVNWLEIKEQKKSKVRFGWFDVIDDIEVTKALLAKVTEIGKSHNLEYMEGPVGFSNMDKAGLLVEGFEYQNTMVTLYNHPYYKTHLESLGFDVSDEWVEYKFNFDKVDAGKLERLSNMISERYDLKIKNFTHKKQVFPYVEEMFDLINETYEKLSVFVRITPEQITYLKHKYIAFINPNFIKCVFDKEDNMVAVAITMPSFSKALKKANGSLFPFGFWHLLQAQKKNDKAEFYLIGIKPSYQNKGVTSLVFNEMLKTFKQFGVNHVETNPELVDNHNVQLLWKKYDSKQHKRRKSYRKDL